MSEKKKIEDQFGINIKKEDAIKKLAEAAKTEALQHESDTERIQDGETQ